MVKKVIALVFVSFSLFISAIAQPANDNCLTATALSIPGSGSICVNGTTVGATSTTWTTANCGQTVWTNDVWYTFVSNGNLNTIVVRPTGNPAAQQLGITVYTGGCAALTGLGTYCGIAANAGDSVQIIQAAPAGTQYWIEVSSFSTAGNFQLCVTSSTPPPAPGTSCGTAAHLCDLSSFSLATGPAGTGAYTPSCFLFGANSSVWYQFTVGTSGIMSWNCTPTTTGTELDWAVFDITNGCGTANLNNNTVACNYNYSGSVSASIGMASSSATICPTSGANGAAGEICPPITLTAGKTYAIFIDNFSNNQSGWNFNWNGSTFQMAPTSSFTVSPDTGCYSLTTTFTNTSIAAVSYAWNFGDGTTSALQNPPAKTYSTPGTYIVSLATTSATGCTDISTKTIHVYPPFTVNAGNDTTICANQTIPLSGTVNTAGAFTYAWTPTGTITNANTVTPSVTPVASTQYYFTATDVHGCSATDSVMVNTSGVAQIVNATVTPAIICPGQQVQLHSDILPVNCGITAPCIGNDTSLVVGAGNTAQPGNGTVPPTLFGNFQKSVRNQMLYTAAELNAALGGPCTIRSLFFNVQVFNSNQALQSFTIKMACTNANSLSTWQGNLSTVLALPQYQPVAGWNGFTLATQFNWDGVSNIVVDICWYNPVTFGNQNNKAQCTTTAFNSYIYANGNTDQCGTVAAPTVSTLRPNIYFYYCIPNITNYSIAWSPNSGANAVSSATIANPTANPIATTNYTVAVTGGGCTGSKTVTVQVDTSKVSAGPDVNSCPNNPNNLTATVTGTVIPGPPTFVWTTLAGANVGNTQAVTVSPATNTTYVVTMNGGTCIKRDTVSITIGGLTVNAAPTNATCFNANNGKIVVSSNGNPPLTYTWSANAATGNIDSAVNLAPGIYNVTVSDATGCSGSATAQITQPTQVTFTSSITNVSCFGGSNGAITLSPSGGTGAYTYTWSGGLPATQTVSNLLSGNYSVTVRDANQCSATVNINVSQPSQIVFNAPFLQNERCFNSTTGIIKVNASGGTGNYSYSWSNNAGLNSATNNALAAGSYSVTLTDANNCTVSASYTISQPAQFSLNVSATNVSCFGFSNGTATAVPVNGSIPILYLWNPSGQVTPTATGLSAQTYTVAATDDSLCTATATVAVNQPAQIQITGNVTNELCNGNTNGAINLTVTNGIAPLSYNWNNGATTQNISNLPAGGYTVTVTDNTACARTASFTVTEPAQLTLNPPLIIDVLCFGANTGSIASSAGGGTTPYVYSWSPAGNTGTISSLSAGNYSLTLTDANNCSTSAVYNVTQPASALSFGNATIVDVLCNGFATGAVTVSVSGGTGTYTYSWSHLSGWNNNVSTSLPAAAYTVTVTDANGCSLAQTNTVNQPPAITFSAPVITNTSCFGGSDGVAQVVPAGGVGNFTYSWNGNAGTNPLSNLAPGNYNVVVTDGNNCTASTTITVNQPPQLISTPIVTNVKCYQGTDGSINANPSGGTAPYSFNWSNNLGGQIISNLPTGLYFVTVTDSKNCTATAAANVNQPTAVSVNATSTQVSCIGSTDGTITASGAGGTLPYSFSLLLNGATLQTNFSGLFTGLSAGNYVVNITDANNCVVPLNVTVAAPIPDVYTYTVDSTSCYGAQYTDGAIHVDGSPFQNSPFKYGVDLRPLQYSGDFFNLKAGSHLITAVNNFGCETKFAVIIPEPNDATADVLPRDTTIQLGESIQLTSSFGPYPASAVVSYSWSPSLGLSCIDCPNPIVNPYNRITQYVLTITYNNHCVVTSGATIIVENNLQVFIPNSFSPNGDGNNDVFQIYGEGIKTVDLKIFNRWGELMYQTNNQFSGWDGTYKGVLQNPAVFVYDIQITYLDDKKTHRVGSISLIR